MPFRLMNLPSMFMGMMTNGGAPSWLSHTNEWTRGGLGYDEITVEWAMPSTALASEVLSTIHLSFLTSYAFILFLS